MIPSEPPADPSAADPSAAASSVDDESIDGDDAGADAVALLRPVRREALVPFLDLDDESDASDGIYAEPLDDGAFLLHTFQPFAIFAEGGEAAHQWFAQFGASLPEIHADPRGVLFFPDTIEPEATTYEGVVAEAGGEGLWLSVVPSRASSFEIGQIFQDAQREIFTSFGLGELLGAAGADDENEDD